MSNESPLDQAALLRRFGGQKSIVARVMQEFGRALPETRLQLEEAIAAGLREDARQAVHKLAGGLETLCAGPSALTARELEEAICTDWPRAVHLLPHFLRQLDLLAPFLENPTQV